MTPATKRARSGLYVKANDGLILRDKKCERLARKVRAALPWLTEADHPAVRTWSEFEILARNCYAILRYASPTNKQGEPRKLLDDYRRLRMSQHTIASSLGMTPASRMAIRQTSRDVPLDLVAQLAQASEMENATEVPSESSSEPTPPRGGKWNAREPDGRFKPAPSWRDAKVPESGNFKREESAPDDDLVSALANTPSTIDETTIEPATDAGTIIVDDESLF
jgi:hypothetical protein